MYVLVFDDKHKETIFIKASKRSHCTYYKLNQIVKVLNC